MKVPPPELLKKAESGDPESQYSLAAMYGAGDFVTKSDVEAARWYRAAADRGQVEAQRNLGLMYIYGEGVSQDVAEGMRWIRVAAEGGSSDAMKALAMAYQQGLYDLEQDNEQASYWLARAEEIELGSE